MEVYNRNNITLYIMCDRPIQQFHEGFIIVSVKQSHKKNRGPSTAGRPAGLPNTWALVSPNTQVPSRRLPAPTHQLSYLRLTSKQLFNLTFPPEPRFIRHILNRMDERWLGNLTRRISSLLLKLLDNETLLKDTVDSHFN